MKQQNIILESTGSVREAVFLMSMVLAIKKQVKQARCYCLIPPESGELISTLVPEAEVIVVPKKIKKSLLKHKIERIKSINPDCFISCSGGKIVCELVKKCKHIPFYIVTRRRKRSSGNVHYIFNDGVTHISALNEFVLQQALSIELLAKRDLKDSIGHILNIKNNKITRQIDKNKKCLYIQTRYIEKNEYPTSIIQEFITKCLDSGEFFVVLGGAKVNNPFIHFKHKDCFNGIGLLSIHDQLSLMYASDYYVGTSNCMTHIASMMNKAMVSFIIDSQWKAEYEGSNACYQRNLDWRTKSLDGRDRYLFNDIYNELSILLHHHSLNLKESTKSIQEKHFMFDLNMLIICRSKEEYFTLKREDLPIFEKNHKMYIPRWTLKHIVRCYRYVSQHNISMILGKAPRGVRLLFFIIQKYLENPMWITVPYHRCISHREWIFLFQKMRKRKYV